MKHREAACSSSILVPALLYYSPNIIMLATKYFILMCVAMRIKAMPNGAPEQACETFIPQHGDAKPSNPTDAPYTVKVRETDSAKQVSTHFSQL